MEQCQAHNQGLGHPGSHELHPELRSGGHFSPGLRRAGALHPAHALTRELPELPARYRWWTGVRPVRPGAAQCTLSIHLCRQDDTDEVALSWAQLSYRLARRTPLDHDLSMTLTHFAGRPDPEREQAMRWMAQACVVLGAMRAQLRADARWEALEEIGFIRGTQEGEREVRWRQAVEAPAVHPMQSARVDETSVPGALTGLEEIGAAEGESCHWA